MPLGRAQHGWMAAGTAAALAFCASCRLMSSRDPCDASSDIATALFGQLRHAFGAELYGAADRFFHRGVPHVEERALKDGFFIRLSRAVAPEEHAHLEGANIKEMLPWLWMSMQMDPGNVETFRVAAFWMAGPINRPDLAMRVLRDARRIHPHNYQLLLDSGRILLRHGDRGGARRAFDAALALWPKHTGEDEELARFEKAELLTFKALLCEMDNQPDQVRELLKEVLVLFPGRDVVRRRLAAMERGEPPEVPAVRLWSQMLLRHGKSMENCGRAGDAHAHGPAEDDPHR